jgi:uncharacterized membrane protein
MSGRWALGGMLIALVVALAQPIAGGVLLLLLGLVVLFWRPRSPHGAPLGQTDALEGRIETLEREVAQLKVQLAAASAPGLRTWGEGPKPEPAATQVLSTAVSEPTVPSVPPPTAPTRPARPPRAPRLPRVELDPSKLFGALGLAWAGGIVTVLGIVFFFVLAANRGWISPELRLGFGAAASIGVFTAGLWLRHRFGTTYAALAAVGAGIAGGFATLLAATALYGFVPEIWALVAATGIAAAATAVAVSWRSELVAGLGLVGALLVPLMTVVEDGELTVVGTSFVAIVFAATAFVARDQRWRALLVAGTAASFPQVAGLVAQSQATDWAVVGLTAAFWALVVAVAIAVQVDSGTSRIEPLGASLVLAASALAAGACAQLFAGEVWRVSSEGLALVALAAAYLALGAAFFPRLRDYSALFGAVGLAVAAVAGAELLTGAWLAVVWAGQAAVLAWLGDATRERRFQVSSVAYLALALGYTLVYEAPVVDLFELSAHPAGGAAGVLAVAAAAGLLAWFLRRPADWPTEVRSVGAVLAAAVAVLHAGRAAFLWLGGVLVAYAASLGLLELSLWIAVDGPELRFERGHVAVSALWAGIGLALVEIGGRRNRLDLSIGGLAFLGLAVLETTVYDLAELGSTRWALAFLLVGGGTLLAGFEYQRLGADRWRFLRPEAAVAIFASLVLGATAVVELADGVWSGIDVEGGALVLLALPYAALAAAVFRRPRLRDLSTLLWAIALAVTGVALGLLLEDVWLVLAWSALSALLSVLALATREVRLQAASAAYLVAALGTTLVFEAPPRDFLVAGTSPGDGVIALLLVATGALVFAFCARHEAPAERPPFSWSQTITLAGLLGALRSWQSSYRATALVGAGVLVLYALSLGLLDAAERISGASVETDFQRGHTAVSAFWGAVGLGLLTLGLLRRARSIRIAGLVLFGISLAKLFLYDLAYLSSLSRALSFLAVGALLLLAGFFYQRLSGRLEERDRAGPRTA